MMTPLYRLVLDLSQQPLTALFKRAPLAEQGGRAVRQKSRIFAVSALTFGAGLSWGLPQDGQVASGQASVSQNGSILTVEQASQQAIINWQSFGVAAGETVNFNQPGASSVALNRIAGSAASEIYGHLNANGQVFLVNANGVYFAPGAQVNVGGLVASTLNISDSDFLSNNFHFAGDSTASISNQGSLTAAQGGYIAFLGREVTNSGEIATPGGTAALGAGSAVDLTLAGNQLLSFQVSSEALAALAENGGLIQADGGKVILRAQAKDALLQTVVNNTGVIRAQTIANQNGSIVLLGGQSGTTQVAGTLDASAPNGGPGGFIETSGAHLKVADGTTITTKSSTDQDGQWLIDPYDFTVATSNGDISGYTLSTALGNGHVTIQTTDTAANCSNATCAAGSSSGNGDIFVNDTVSWSANTLTLDAWRNIDINVPMNGSNTAGLALKYGQGSTTGTIGDTLATYNINAPVNLTSAGSFSTQLGIHGTVDTYTIITSLGSEGSTSTTDLQGINGGLSANYVLGTNIDATATSGWNSNAGFVPLGNSQIKFTGSFDGLGHTISALTINRPTFSYVGLFGYTESAVVKNIGLVGGNITGFYYVGGLVGKAAGVTQAPPMFAFPGMFFPGMPGMPAQPVTPPNNTKISNVFATGNIKGHAYLGGLVGDAINTDISNAYATGSVSGTGDRLGGLVGRAVGGTISNAYATGNVSGSASGSQFGNVISGPLVADVSFTTIMTNGYWNSTASVAGNTSGTSLTAEKMSKQSSFDGFDFGTVWTIHEGHSTPLLRSFLTPLMLKYSGGDKVRTYSGDTFAVSARYSINGADTSGHLFGLDYDGAVNVGSYSANLWSDQEGYIITAFGSNDLTITPADLTVSGSRSYDTTTLVSGAVLTATGVNNEVFNVTGSGHASNLSSANVQTDSVLASVTGLGLGVSTNGGLAANYTALKAAGSKVSITKAKLTLSDLILSGSRIYDGTTVVSGDVLTATGVNNEVFNVTGSGHASNLSSANVQTDSVLASVTGLGLGISANGGNATNYTALNTKDSKVSITPAELKLSGSRLYDASTLVLGDVLTATGVNNETFSVIGSGDGSNLSSANVQTDSVLASVTGLGLGISANGGNATNYTALKAAGSVVSITPAELKLSGSRLYDARKIVSGAVLTATGVNNETFSVTGSGDASNLSSANVQTDSVLASLTGLALDSSANGGDASNYTALKAAGSVVSITPAGLALSSSDVSKTYDATTDALGSGAITSGQLYGNDSIDYSGLNYAFSDANAGSNKTVNVSGSAAISDGNSGNNYVVTLADNAASEIQKAGLKLSGSRLYDASKVVSGAVLTATGVNGETFSVTGSGDASNLSSANIQTNSVLASLTGLALNSSANGGDATNYTALKAAGSVVSITPAELKLSGSRLYDASALVLGDVLTATGVNGETFSVTGSGDASNLSSVNVQTDSVLASLTGLALNSSANGGDASNYTVLKTAGSVVSITPAELKLSGSRLYDASTLVLGDVLTATGVNGETFSVIGSGDASNLSSANIQTDSVLASVTGLALDTRGNGGDASNYMALKAAGSVVSITPVEITLSASDVTKTYDGTKTYTSSPSGSAVNTSGKLFGSDSINHAGLSYAFSDANAGSNKTVNVSGSAAISDGNSGNNYAVTFVESTASAIKKADLKLSGSRTYDGTTVVLSDVLAATGVNNEVFNVTGSGDASNLSSANVQTDSVLASLTGLVLGSSTNGGLVGNYTPLRATGSRVSITPAGLALSGSRIYDGTTMVPGYTLTATGVNNETFSVTGSGDASNLRSEDVQADSVLTSVTGLVLGVSTNGGLVGNYTPLKAPGSAVSVTNSIGRRIMGMTSQTMESGSSTVNAGASSSLDPEASYKRRHGRDNRANVELDVIFERDVTAN